MIQPTRWIAFVCVAALAAGASSAARSPAGTRPSELPASSFQPQATRPDRVVILADDLGWQDVALPLWDQETPLNRRYRTPNITRLAAEGMKFTNAYAAAPVCTPTRVTEITGRS